MEFSVRLCNDSQKAYIYSFAYVHRIGKYEYLQVPVDLLSFLSFYAAILVLIFVFKASIHAFTTCGTTEFPMNFFWSFWLPSSL